MRVASGCACDNGRVNESEFLERFDAHLVENRELMGEIRVINGEIRDEMRLSREQHADLRLFTRDLTRRNEVVLGEMVTSLNDLQAEIGDARTEIQAQTQALLNVLDRLN